MVFFFKCTSCKWILPEYLQRVSSVTHYWHSARATLKISRDAWSSETGESAITDGSIDNWSWNPLSFLKYNSRPTNIITHFPKPVNSHQSDSIRTYLCVRYEESPREIHSYVIMDISDSRAHSDSDSSHLYSLRQQSFLIESQSWYTSVGKLESMRAWICRISHDWLGFLHLCYG